MFNNIPPPAGMPELVAILAIVRDADKLAEAVQHIEDARERANATRKQASEEVEAAMTEAAMVRQEAEQARDEMLTAATLEAKRIRDEAQAEADSRTAAAHREAQALARQMQEVNDRSVALDVQAMDLQAKRDNLADQSASLKRREDALREREAKLKELVG